MKPATSHSPCESAERPDPAQRQQLFAWALLASLLPLAVLAAPGLLGYVYTRDDLGAFHLPLRGFYAGQLTRGEPFDWMPQRFRGFYLTGEGQAGTLPFDQAELHAGSQMTLVGWHRADGYVGLEPARKLDYRQLPALQAAGVRWVRRCQATEAIEGLLPHDDHWLEVPDPSSRVRLVTEAVASDDPARDVARISLRSAALVDEPLDLPPGQPGRATVAGERPGRIRIAVKCPSRQLLVVSDSFHPGWRAEVDPEPQPVLRVNGDFLGCVVGPGPREERVP